MTSTSNHISNTFIWSPGHSGIPSNQNVHRKAKKALLLLTVALSYLPTNSDLVLFINKFIRLSWASFWKDQSHNILAQLRNYPRPWNSSNQPSQHLEITFTRLHTGLTHLAHTNLLTHLTLLTCPNCSLDLPLSIEHNIPYFNAPNSPPFVPPSSSLTPTWTPPLILPLHVQAFPPFFNKLNSTPVSNPTPSSELIAH